MKQLESSGIGCAMILITLGALGLLSTVVDLGSSNRAIWVLFEGLAGMFGSMTMFSILAIGVGLLIILFIFLAKEISSGKEEKAQAQRSKYKTSKW
ncbi:MAG: hypothetical protein AB1649_05250 [Chloroflexota bacterium]